MIARRRPTSRGGCDGGQATVELALALPVLCLFLLGVVQVMVVVRNQLWMVEAARVGARAAAVAADPGGAGGAAGRSAAPPGASVAIDVSGTTVTARVTVVDHTDVPIIGALVPDVQLEAEATMLLDPPPP